MTDGYKTAQQLDAEWDRMQVPSLARQDRPRHRRVGRVLLPRAEAAGATKVVALDHFVWSIDPLEKMAYEGRQRELGEKVRTYEEVGELWRPDELPGKRSFDLAHDLLDKFAVEPVVSWTSWRPTRTTWGPRRTSCFFLGVLYHLKDPVGALERLRRVAPASWRSSRPRPSSSPGIRPSASRISSPATISTAIPRTGGPPPSPRSPAWRPQPASPRSSPSGTASMGRSAAHAEYLAWAATEGTPEAYRARPHGGPRPRVPVSGLSCTPGSDPVQRGDQPEDTSSRSRAHTWCSHSRS